MPTKKEQKKINARTEKWRKMLPNLQKLHLKSDKKLKTRIRKGIPDCIRLKAWPLLAEVEKYQK
jgi:hypothetical protein